MTLLLRTCACYIYKLFVLSSLTIIPIFTLMASSPTPTNPIPTRDDEDNVFKERRGIFDKLLKLLVGILAFKFTDEGRQFFKTQHYMMVFLVLVIVLHFSAWLVVTAPQLHARRAFLSFITCFVLIIGVIFSVWALIIML